MPILLLPHELLMLIAAQLDCRDLNALLRTHSSLYNQLIGCLYRWNLRSRGFAALIWAAKRGSTSTLQRFLDIGVDLSWKSRYRAQMSHKLHRVSSMADTKRDHPICHAVTSGQADFVRKLIENGADINFKDVYGRSPLALAARQGNFTLVQMLISLGANPLSYDRLFHRPAANAASQGHYDIADYLLQELGKYKHSPIRLDHTIMAEIQWMLLYAAKEGNEKQIRLCLSKGADINFQPRGERCTPLCGALLSAPAPQALRVVKLLLGHGADPNIALPAKRSSPGWKLPPNLPLGLAMLRDESLQLIKALLRAGADVRQCGLALFDAIRLEKATEFRLLVDHHADLNIRLKGKSLAEYALQSGCQSIQKACLSLDDTAPTRQLATRTISCRRTCHRPAGRRLRNDHVSSETILPIRPPVPG
ncbi:Ankyrin repeat protein [Aspergillus fischeri NRRL 181]|uniref:Ankyrin repeat protein n=1 Tax=Neosartorya fischeri (strain ATCC 1020 / DSM 3700 / CBS 544.65 / FGSC A1164 / JCM 1740 / NRRL 181 / WB 181) TaxID=331117 RepID=A1DJ43_NEOFI|nr:Ankyrin repeat protein [Aspergillus fischeri NRRL 181]EAW16732.1 Ankyrin repeat protein [Aspergillus fischeri NRRL 181]KAG2001665.1 hypothetical protein GB937_010007 [Aspergillus fischeri]